MKGIRSNFTTIVTNVLALSIVTLILAYWLAPPITTEILMLLFVVDFFYVLVKRDLSIQFNIPICLWFLFLMVSVFGLFNHGVPKAGIIHTLNLTIIFLNYLFLTSDIKLFKKTVYLLCFLLLFFLLGSLLQLINPELVYKFNSAHFTGIYYDEIQRFYRSSSLNGITYQTGINSFILSVLSSISYSKSLTSKHLKKYIWVISYLLLFYLIILTEKRGFLLFNIVIIIYLTISNKKHKFRNLLIITALIIFIYSIFMNTEVGLKLIERTVSNNDITSGRVGPYNFMWNDFLEKPFLGHGTYTTTFKLIINNGHNIYLQVLRENGLIGFSLLISFLIANFIKTVKLRKYYINSTNESFYLVLSLYNQLLFVLWGATGNPLYDYHTLIIYFIAISIPIIIGNKNKINLIK